jgi:hypothetical protein
MASWRAKVPVDELEIFDGRPDHVHAYESWEGACWWVIGPWDDDLLVLRSSRLIVIRKDDGRVVYDGEAGDEG